MVLEIGHSSDPWSPGITTLIQEGDVHAALSYVPDYGGTPLAKRAAKAWLCAALAGTEY